MRRITLVAWAVGLVATALLAATTFGQGEKVTVTGKLIDLYCYAQDKNDTGMHHGQEKECAMACVKYTGMPVGILTDDGHSYEIVGPWTANNNAKIAPLITQRVRVIGALSVRDGMPTVNASDLTEVK